MSPSNSSDGVPGERRTGTYPLNMLTNSPQRLLTVAVPGGFERLFTDLGEPALPGTAAPPIPGREALAAAVRRLGVEVVGPPPAFDTR